MILNQLVLYIQVCGYFVVFNIAYVWLAELEDLLHSLILFQAEHFVLVEEHIPVFSMLFDLPYVSGYLHLAKGSRRILPTVVHREWSLTITGLESGLLQWIRAHNSFFTNKVWVELYFGGIPLRAPACLEAAEQLANVDASSRSLWPTHAEEAKCFVVHHRICHRPSSNWDRLFLIICVFIFRLGTGEEWVCGCLIEWACSCRFSLSSVHEPLVTKVSSRTMTIFKVDLVWEDWST